MPDQQPKDQQQPNNQERDLRLIEALDFDFVPSRLPKATQTFSSAPVETQRAAVNRGLSPAAYRLKHESKYPPSDYPLSAEQLAAANLLLDFSDNRSHAAKLKSIGVSTTRYNNWLRNAEFAAYLRERAEQLVDNTGHEAHTSLLRQVQRGNMQAIQYYNQLTGRFTPGAETQMNVAAVMIRIVEAVQRHVKDPEVIRAIAQEFQGIMGSDSALPAPVEISGAGPDVTRQAANG